MLQWISNNSSVINSLANVAMLAVWMTYLSIFLHNYRRQKRPKIVINQAAGSALSAACFISNMSSEAIYVEAVIATVRWGGEEARETITDFEVEDPENTDPQQQTFQGPLGSGSYVSLGSFSNLVSRVIDKSALDQDPSVTTATVEILVVADHLADDLVIGAKRNFVARRKGDLWLVSPETSSTHQMRSRSERRSLRRMTGG